MRKFYEDSNVRALGKNVIDFLTEMAYQACYDFDESGEGEYYYEAFKALDLKPDCVITPSEVGVIQEAIGNGWWRFAKPLCEQFGIKTSIASVESYLGMFGITLLSPDELAERYGQDYYDEDKADYDEYYDEGSDAETAFLNQISKIRRNESRKRRFR